VEEAAVSSAEEIVENTSSSETSWDEEVIAEEEDMPVEKAAVPEQSFDEEAFDEESGDVVDQEVASEEDLVVVGESYDMPEMDEEEELESFDAIGVEVAEGESEVLEETVEDIFDEVVDEGDWDSDSTDTVVGELEVSELNEEPVLVREDEENNVLGVEDGLGGQIMSKLFGGI